MKQFFSTFAGVSLLAASALPAFAQSAPNVRPGDKFCFNGLPESQINILPESQAGNARKQMRGPKLGDSKYDNFDGHDLREVPSEGNYNVLVVLVEFKDAVFTQGKDDPKALISDMLNGENYNYQGATSSANHYFKTVSDGQFNPIFNVVGPVYLDKLEETYVVNDPNDTYIYEETGKPVTVYRPGRMVEEVVAILDDEVDFSKYDSNGDGYVDFIYFFHAGKGATTGGDRNKTIWPHAFTLNSAIGHPVEHDGVLINRYATSAEIGADGKLTGIGTFCHEFSHVLGFPDLYDTSSNNGTASKCFTPGSFDCLDAGNYNNNQKSPATYSVYERYALEWMKPVDLTGAGSFTMLPLEAYPFGYKVKSSKDNEYFFLENRGRTYYDQYLDGHGLLVWHIDFDLDRWNANTPNNTKDHQMIDIIEADNDQNASTRNGDVFPGISGICEYTATVSPSFKDWSNKATGLELYKIRHNFDNTTEFIVTSADGKEMPGAAIDAPAPVLTGVAADAISIEWNAVKGAGKYFVSVFPASALTGMPLNYSDYEEGYCFRLLSDIEEEDGVLSATLSGLRPNVNYAVMLYAAGDVNASRMQAPLFASTVDASDFENASANLILENAENTVLAFWDDLNADSYDLSVVTRTSGEATGETLNADFTGNRLPDNWTGTGRYSTQNGYFGESSPAYRLEQPDSYLESPVYDDCISEISFFAVRRRSYDDGSMNLKVMAADNSGKWSVVTDLNDVPYPGKNYSIALPADTHAVKFLYNFVETGLDLCLDDLSLTFCKAGVETPVNAEIESLSETSAAIRGLENGKEYIAYVTPHKNNAAGKRSNEVTFALENLPVSGIEDIVADADFSGLFNINGMTITPADSAMSYSVYAIDGTTVAEAHTGTLTLSERGIYLIHTSGKTLKVRL